MNRQQEAGRPFLCFVPTNAPHSPHVELDRYVEPYLAVEKVLRTLFHD